jgi:hypothetical protein
VATNEAVQQLATAGIHTVVVGIPGSDKKAYVSALNQFAESGGLPDPDGGAAKYYAVTEAGGVEGLANVIKVITSNLITSCVLELTEPPPASNLVNVYIEGNVVPQDSENGWKLVGQSIELVGTTCDRVKQGVTSIRVEYGCETVR